MPPRVMFRNSDIRFDDILDGASQTLLLGESSARASDGRWADASHCCVHTNQPLHDNPAYWASMHTGGVNFLLADGSVRFIHDDVQTHVLVALTTREGEESISNTDF